MMTTPTRRSFLTSAAAVPFALRSMAQTRAAARWVLLGTGEAGIYRASWDPASGHLGTPELAIAAERPDFLAVHPKLPGLYAVNSVSGAGAAISSFHLDTSTASLTFGDRQPSGGDGPCCVSVDATGRMAFAANYAGGSFAAYPLGADGSLQPAAGQLVCKDNPECGKLGPVHDRQDAAHLHCATVSPGNDFVLACDLGSDAIQVFPIHPGAANPLGAPQRSSMRPGSGPRHVAFHPNGRWVYVINEIECTVDLCDWSVSDAKGGTGAHASVVARPGTTVSTLPPGAKLAGNTACEILTSPDGAFVYTCTRGPGSDNLVVFHVDPASGKLTEQQRLACGGTVPRHIAFDPTRRWLLAANQGSSTVAVFAHEPRSGKLTGPVRTVAAKTPMFVLFV